MNLFRDRQPDAANPRSLRLQVREQCGKKLADFAGYRIVVDNEAPHFAVFAKAGFAHGRKLNGPRLQRWMQQFGYTLQSQRQVARRFGAQLAQVRKHGCLKAGFL